MFLAKTRNDLAQQISAWKDQGSKIGFVPTMGALHEGHLSLCDIARKQADKVVVSIFVNPSQFAPHEDLDTYPRTLERDLEQLRNRGLAELVYAPRVEDIYPNGVKAHLTAGKAARGLESDFRPHFFNGVVSVVHTLFEQIRPDYAVFGEKDFQQLMVIREMVQQHAMKIEIIGAPTARDSHGLALSSRNAYLSAQDLEIARMMNQIIYMAAHEITQTMGAAEDSASVNLDTDIAAQNTRQKINAILEDAAQSLLNSGFDSVDYVTYKPEWRRVLAAAWLGRTRLIDNAPIGV